ncbi:hypothetical protein EWF69_18055 [Salmonella enterica subsp. enterica serovar Thompson]|nr:hypothetical protein [Salmonella enterica subsp. enterica serovar Thompson]EBW7959354.1 hypothetical protein [Salmonella enterica subsp. enterica serovar Thompson]ECD1771542.1 hypothetical protein [Salmonella enterica subsp. enterica serovar Thompson]
MKNLTDKEQISKLVSLLKESANAYQKMLTEAADFIEEINQENDELRDQIAKPQTTDYQSLDDLPVKSVIAFHDNHFTNGDRVRLKLRPDITGTIGGYTAFWLMHGSVIAYHVLLDHMDEYIPIVTTALELLPEADDAKQ